MLLARFPKIVQLQKFCLLNLQCLNMNGMSEETVDRFDNLPHIDRIEVHDL